MEEKRICPECKANISNHDKTCPFCGFPLDDSRDFSEIKNNSISKKSFSTKQIVGMVMCVAALVCIIIGITRITNDTYKFYKEHLNECMDAYGEVKAEANHSYGWFSSTYDWIADNYEDMIAEDRKELWSYRIQAIVLCGAGAVLIALGVPKIKQGGENDGID